MVEVVATTTTMMTTTKRRTTWPIAEDLEICLRVARSLASLFKTLAGTPQTLRMSSRTFSQRQKRTSRTSSLRGFLVLINLSINSDHKICRNAKRAPSSEEDVPGPSQSSNFRGAGTTVGGEGTESRTIPDPAGPHAPSRTAEELPVVTRTLHLWRDGFSIEDGPLRRYDDPEHAMDLQMIRTGRAPLHLMEVEHGQRCDVRLQQHEEDWHQLPRIYKPFGGQGRRLGSPVPGDGNAAPAVVQTPAAPAISAPAGSPASLADVDPSQPTVAIRFQMPDGSRLPARFNLTHTIGDLYQFARSASAETRVRAFTVQSTFPTKEYTDHSQLLGEVDAFKRGGIAVVKWA